MDQEDQECAICLEALCEKQVAVLGCCRKRMHAECLVQCLKEKLACPMCRATYVRLRMVLSTDDTLVNKPVSGGSFFVAQCLLLLTVLTVTMYFVV